MPMPGTEEIRKPLLEAFRGEAPHSFVIAEMLGLVAEYYGINLNDLSSGEKNILKSNINEAKSALKKHGLIYNPSGSTYMITNAGTEILEDGQEIITDEYLKARKKKPLIIAETFGVGKPEIQDTTPESDTLTDDSQDISLDDEPALEPEIQDTTPESDTLPGDSQDISPDDDKDLEPEIQDTTPEPDTLTDDSQDISLDDDTELEPEIQEDTPESETLPGDSQDISLDNDTELEPEIQEDTPEPEILPGESQDISLDDSPEEILDTEEVYTDTMPEDLFSQDETQNEQEYAPNTDTEEEEYDPSLVAEAMSSGTIDDVIARHNSELADQLLMKAAGLPSDKFEMLVIDLLSKMGYFAFQTARYTTEASGSGLIHGVILDNKTGANIYIQARKLSPGRTVSKADIQDFIDELADKGGKGIFATTANFSENAQILAADERLMLIDGERLTNLMIANNFCVNVEKVYEIKAIDSESFSEYEE